MQYPKALNDNNSWQVSEVQSGRKVGELSGSVSHAGQTNLIVNYLPSDMTESELLDIFCKVGEVAKHKIVRNKHTGKSLAYGFVEFKNASDAKMAQIMCNRYMIRGKALKVAFARPQSEDIINANLYVAALPRDVDESQLATLFGCYGTVIDVKVLRCKYSGYSRGAGFVRFDQRLSAEVAMKALDNYVFKDATRPISVKLANSATRPPLHPESQRPDMRFEEPVPCRKLKMKTKIEQAAMRSQEPCHLPQAIKREMEAEAEIKQTAKRGQESYPLPPFAKRHMEYNIQQPEIQRDAKRSQDPWVGKRPMDSEIEQIAKRACGYVDTPTK